jgi:hypothetical protein
MTSLLRQLRRSSGQREQEVFAADPPVRTCVVHLQHLALSRATPLARTREPSFCYVSDSSSRRARGQSDECVGGESAGGVKQCAPHLGWIDANIVKESVRQRPFDLDHAK